MSTIVGHWNRVPGWIDWPLAWKAYVVVALYVIAVAILASGTLLADRAVEDDAIVVDLAGQQRVLNQRYMKEVLLSTRGQNLDLEATQTLLKETLTALRDGGVVTVNLATGERRRLPGVENEVLRQKLNEYAELLDLLMSKSAAFVATRVGSQSSAAELAELSDLNRRVHESANAFSELLAQQSEANRRYSSHLALTFALVIAVIAAVLSWRVAMTTLDPIRRTRAVLEKIAAGDFREGTGLDGPDEIHRMAAAVDGLRVGLADVFDAECIAWNEVAEGMRDERRRLDMATAMVESATTNVVMADMDLTIRYLNPASKATFKRLEPYLPVPADEILGQSVEFLLTDPVHTDDFLRNDQNLPHVAEIRLGSEDIKQEVCAIHDRNGNRMGTMLSWAIVTERKANRRQVQEAAARQKLEAESLHAKLSQLLPVVEAAANGDLTRTISVQGQDAMGQIGRSLVQLFAAFRGSLGEMGEHARTLAGAAEALASVSSQMGGNADATSAQANAVSTASEQVSDNVETLASAAGEIDGGIQEIAQNAADAARVAATAVQMAESTDATVRKLSESSTSIDNVIKVITSIAEQTNLLALNATIEAARAGEAGKGFAVVANEVKELAKETSNATEDIARKIEAIRVDSAGAVEAIGAIGDTIKQISEIQNSIASAVSAHTETTKEMSRSVTDAAQGSAEIASNMTTVAAGAESTRAGAGEVHMAATELAQMASELQRLVNRFRYA